MENIFYKFESVDFLLDGTEAPKIKAGGSSSSNVLNRYFEATNRDLIILATRANALADRATRFSQVANTQAGALLASLQSLSSRVDAASAYNQVLADMHSAYYVDNTTTAEINHMFGQATLPIRGSTDLLVSIDIYGNKYITNEVEISWCSSAATAPNSISNSLYQVDPNGLYMLLDQQTWLTASPSSSGINVFLKIKTPLQFRGLQPNVLEVYPFPAFGTDLLGIWYQKVDDANPGTWYALDLTYLPNYSNSLSRVVDFGPIRAFIPDNTVISQLVIGINPKSSPNVGFKNIKLLNLEFETNAVLAVKDPSSRTITAQTIRGKDLGELSQLTVVRSGNTATINMTTDNNAKTPVITGVILKV